MIFWIFQLKQPYAKPVLLMIMGEFWSFSFQLSNPYYCPYLYCNFNWCIFERTEDRATVSLKYLYLEHFYYRFHRPLVLLTVGFWCQTIHKKFLRRFDIIFGLKMMMKSGLEKNIFKLNSLMRKLFSIKWLYHIEKKEFWSKVQIQ